MIGVSPLVNSGVAHAAPFFRICVKCDEPFTPYPGKPGRINECEACSREYVFPLRAEDIPNALVQIAEGDDSTRYVEMA